MRKRIWLITLLLIVAAMPVMIVSARAEPISDDVLNKRAIYLPVPDYPLAAKKAGADGQVEVEVVIDEAGLVSSAKAISGHELLLDASVNAARRARFEPTKLEGKSVKVQGLLIYQFRME